MDLFVAQVFARWLSPRMAQSAITYIADDGHFCATQDDSKDHEYWAFTPKVVLQFMMTCKSYYQSLEPNRLRTWTSLAYRAKRMWIVTSNVLLSRQCRCEFIRFNVAGEVFGMNNVMDCLKATMEYQILSANGLRGLDTRTRALSAPFLLDCGMRCFWSHFAGLTDTTEEAKQFLAVEWVNQCSARTPEPADTHELRQYVSFVYTDLYGPDSLWSLGAFFDANLPDLHAIDNNDLLPEELLQFPEL
jgi:hypothetical protein